jgi:hypothetical protein
MANATVALVARPVRAPIARRLSALATWDPAPAGGPHGELMCNRS